ncbi:MAG: hypothetical protein EOO27_02010 [Comamonadaceae bacterium]|nr:MAG: hypothetical protein EOO27_02010 [Comamonadaceae bacterium]
MKILDFAVLTLFSGASSLGWAQSAGTAPSAPSGSVPASKEANCTSLGCSGPDGLLFQLQTRGKRAPVTSGTTDKSSSEELQPDRRVTIEVPGTEPKVEPVAQPGKAVASGKFSMQLPNGGVIWATEDPSLGVPELSVSAPTMLPFDNGKVTKPVQFYVRSNYPGFIQRYELTIYRGTDVDLIEPLARVAMPVSGVSQATWDGALDTRYPLRAGDELLYVLRAYDANGDFDETYSQPMQLVRPEEEDQATRGLRERLERTTGRALTAQQAQTQSLIDNVFGGSKLRQQNILIYGSRIRIQGRNLPLEHGLLINGADYPVDLEGKFAAEFLAPIGRHRFDLVLKNRESKPVVQQSLDIEVTGKYFFGIGLADLTVFQNKATGPGRSLGLNGRTDDVLADGRLAFYGKAKLEGKYLITAQADTEQRDIGDLFSGFTRADARDVFRRLDPNQYYPVYGDDSTTFRDVDTQGRFYLRAEWDKNQALWGNYATGFAGTQYAQYVRSLYGAAVDWRTNKTNPWGDPRTQIRAFGSEAQTAPGHSEFLGTGGSLYYLHHTDVLPGSEIVTVEIRNPRTGSVDNRIVLTRGVDYTINELQGRLLLTKPLSQIASESNASITRDTPLDGLEQRLLVDYEWIPTDFNRGNLAAGIRAKQWVNDHIAVGGTVVEEKRAGDDYSLKGVDLTLQAGRGTFLKMEHSKSESTGTPVFFSSNGGFSFNQLNATTGPRSGSASAIEGQANLKELGWTDDTWTLGAWWRHVDEGYSVARFDIGQETTEFGAKVRGQITDDLSIYALHSRIERGRESLDQTQVTAEWRPTEDDTVSAEVRRVTGQRLGGTSEGTLGAVKYDRRINSNLNVYGIGQKTLDNDGGRYADNDAVTLGAKYRFANLSSISVEGTHGDRGNAARIGGEYQLTPEHSVYGNFTHTTDDSEYDSVFNKRQQGGWTLGQRWRVSDKTNIFNESQYLKDPNSGAGLMHTFGLDFYPAVGWNTGLTLQQGELESSNGNVHRRAVSINAGHTSPRSTWASKLEWRQDTGAEQRTQWVTTNRFNHKIDESLRVSAKFNYSDTKDRLNRLGSAKFVEAGAGFAWRPYDDARYAVLGRYTYLYDLATLGQVGRSEYDQKSHVVSLEGTYKLDRNWELGAKVARREGSARYGRGMGQWFNSSTTLVAGQLRYELPQQWHAMAEFRMLDVKNGGTRKGWMVGLDRDIGKNLRVGVGYNFTDFSDDLTKLDYKYKGFFINLVGSY